MRWITTKNPQLSVSVSNFFFFNFNFRSFVSSSDSQTELIRMEWKLTELYQLDCMCCSLVIRLHQRQSIATKAAPWDSPRPQWSFDPPSTRRERAGETVESIKQEGNEEKPLDRCLTNRELIAVITSPACTHFQACRWHRSAAAPL